MSSSSVPGSVLGIIAPMTGATNLVAGVAGSVPTPSAGDQQKALLGDGTWGTVGGGQITKDITQTGHGFVVGNWIRLSAAATYAKAQANNSANAELVGVVTAVTDANTFTVTVSGYVETLTGLTANSIYFLSDLTAGAMAMAEPTAVSSISKPVFYSDTTTSGYLLPYRGSPAQGQTAVVQYGENNGIADGQTTSSATFVDVTGGSFTLPSAGTYEIDYYTYSNNTTAAYNSFRLVDNSNVLVPNSQGTMTNASASYTQTVVQKVRVVVSTATTYKLQWSVNTGTGNLKNAPSAGGGQSGTSKITWLQIGASPVPMDLLGEYGENNVIVDAQTTTSTAYADVTGSAFTLPTAGTWDIDYIVFTKNSASTAVNKFVVTDAANNIVANSQSGYEQVTGVDVVCPAVQKVRITTSASASYKLRWLVSSNTGSLYNNGSLGALESGHSKITWRKISGFIPSSGQTVDYSAAYLGTSQAAMVVNDHIKFDSVTSGNIPLDASTTYSTALNVASIGRFTLTAGKTYRLEASAPQITTTVAAADAQIAWYNADSGVQLGTAGIVYGQANNTIQTSNYVSTVFTPSLNTRVEVRVLTISSGSFTVLGGVGANTRPAWASITQLGSSSAITSSNATPVVQTFLTSGTYTPTAGVKFAIVEMVGGGGGGGGALAGSAANVGSGSGGGAGGYIKAILTASQIGTSQAVTIGAAGAAGANTGAIAGTGGSTTFGALLTASGGLGGDGFAGGGFLAYATAGGNGGGFTITTGTDNGSATGSQGGGGFATVVSTAMAHSSGCGASSKLGQGASGRASAASNATNGTLIGNAAGANTGGGGGGANGGGTGSTATTGGAGGTGKVIITEFFGMFTAF